jgi:hypothetical protein
MHAFLASINTSMLPPCFTAGGLRCAVPCDSAAIFVFRKYNERDGLLLLEYRAAITSELGSHVHTVRGTFSPAGMICGHGSPSSCMWVIDISSFVTPAQQRTHAIKSKSYLAYTRRAFNNNSRTVRILRKPGRAELCILGKTAHGKHNTAEVTAMT